MRHLARKLLSAALAAVMLASPLTAYASDALGHDLAAAGAALNTGTELADGTFWSDAHSDLRRENYVVYTPNRRVTPVVAYGDTTRSLTTAPNAAKALEEQGYRVVAGVNGDYYGTAHGVPLGSTMVNGELRNLNGDPYYAVGFRADGTALIGDPQLSMRVSVNGDDAFDVFAFNHIRQSEYGVFLYDGRFNDRGTTGTSEPGVDVICSVTDGALTIGGTLTLCVDEVLSEATDTLVEEGKYVLTANLLAGERYTAPLLALQPGDELAVSVIAQTERGSLVADERWNDVVNLIGAPELLVEDGVVRSGLPAGSAPRSAIGQRADGSLVFYTIDGRQSGYSIGATLTAVAMRLVELGCVTAVALDGGGSTTLVATMPNETAARVVNVPSEGGCRAVSNHVFLVAPNQASGRLDHVYLAPSASRALPGARIALTAAAIDTNYIPMDASVRLRADGGTLSDGTLTLPDAAGTVTVTASYNGKSAKAAIEVMEPEYITLTRGAGALSSLTVAPGGSVKLTAEAWHNHLTLAGDNSCFTWTLEGEGMTLDDAQTLTAGEDAATGTLTVSLGERSVSIPVTVAVTPFQTGADFEAAFEPLVSEDGGATLTQESSASRVHNGRASARLDYTAAESSDDEAFAASVIPVHYPIPRGHDVWSVWYLADAPCAFDLVFDNGARSDVFEYRQDDGGWQLAAGIVPAGATAITGIVGDYAPTLENGTLWLDQLVFSYGDSFDTAAPAVSLTLDANALSGRAFDATDAASLPTLRLTFDGRPIEYAYDRRTGVLSAALPEPDGLAHYVTLTAGDASGNLSRASVCIPAAETLEPAFPDLDGHWAAGAVEYLKREGITNGSGGLYLPDADISRQEFATMLYRYLSPEEDYSGVELPFADGDTIASWALDAARAMYALGIVGGSLDLSGKLCYNPRSSITRREAATMVGRLLEKGYAAPPPPYADAGSVPGWAAEHVAVLGALGVFDDFAGDEFLPTVPLTRAEMASMLLRIN